MYVKSLRSMSVFISSCIFSTLLASGVQAGTVNWTTWNYPQVTGLTTGSATGSTSDVGVSYSGNVTYPNQIGGFVWLPTTTFSGGTVSNAPPSPYTEITLTGGTGTGTNTITFSEPVLNPVLAIASLGQGGITAQFVFNSNEPFTIQAGGPSANFGGSSIYLCSALVVCGQEGSGVIQFSGAYKSLSWTNPTYENYYLITVGDQGLAPTTTPLPAALPLFGSGLLGLMALGRRRKATAARLAI